MVKICRTPPIKNPGYANGTSWSGRWQFSQVTNTMIVNSPATKSNRGILNCGSLSSSLSELSIFFSELTSLLVTWPVGKLTFHVGMSVTCPWSFCFMLILEMCVLQVCAIVGGTFTVTGIIDSILFTASSALKKAQIGKLSWCRLTCNCYAF